MTFYIPHREHVKTMHHQHYVAHPFHKDFVYLNLPLVVQQHLLVGQYPQYVVHLLDDIQ